MNECLFPSLFLLLTKHVAWTKVFCTRDIDLNLGSSVIRVHVQYFYRSLNFRKCNSSLWMVMVFSALFVLRLGSWLCIVHKVLRPNFLLVQRLDCFSWCPYPMDWTFMYAFSRPWVGLIGSRLNLVHCLDEYA